MKEMLKDIKNISIYDIAIFLLYLCSGIVLTTAILFTVGLSIGWLNFLIPFLGVIVLFIYREKDIRRLSWIIVLAMILFIITIAISSNVFDHTWDGAMYHKVATGFLKNGWNPLLLSANRYNEISRHNICAAQNSLQWTDCYPKGSWYFAGVIYYMTNNIEAGKAYTMIFMIVLFGFIYQYTSAGMKKKWKVIMISFLGAFNPIAVCQMQTYYNDGLAGCVLLSLIIQLLFLFDERYRKTETYMNITALIIIGCNLKFSVTLFTSIFCIIAFIILLKVNEKKKYGLRLFVYFAFSAFVAIMVVGCAPYITNLMRYGDILYGFSGLVQGGIGSDFGIDGLNGMCMALTSLLGRMGNVTYHSLNELLKLPFTFSPNELYYYLAPDARTGGMGIYFGGIFLVSITIIIWWIVKEKGNRKNLQTITLILFIIATFLELLFLPGTYQIRYIPHFYIVFLVAFYILLQKQKVNKVRNAICMLLFCFAVANIFPWFMVSLNRIKEGAIYKAELMSLANEKDDDLIIAFERYDFGGYFYNLSDYGIEVYSFADKNDLKGDIKTIYGNSIIYTIEGNK